MKGNIQFSNPMTRREKIFSLFYLPFHVSFLPSFLMFVYSKGLINETEMNFLCYAIGLAMTFLYEMGYLRRQFDPFLDRFGFCNGQIILSYGIMLGCNLLLNTVLSAFADMTRNPNNQSVMELADYGNNGVIFAITVFMAPIIEEILFRGGLFGWLRPYSRFWAYAAVVLVFSLCHVWPYLMLDWRYAVFLLQYIPVGILLCRLYEKTGSIWSCILFHMLNNFVAMKILGMIGEFV